MPWPHEWSGRFISLHQITLLHIITYCGSRYTLIGPLGRQGPAANFQSLKLAVEYTYRDLQIEIYSMNLSWRRHSRKARPLISMVKHCLPGYNQEDSLMLSRRHRFLGMSWDGLSLEWCVDMLWVIGAKVSLLWIVASWEQSRTDAMQQRTRHTASQSTPASIFTSNEHIFSSHPRKQQSRYSWYIRGLTNCFLHAIL